MAEKPPVFLHPEALSEIRRQTDWPQLLAALGIECDAARSKPGDTWAHSPFAEDRTASFHVSDNGWYCFSQGTGGGVLELVRAVKKHREGVEIDSYAAARWLLEAGLSHYAGEERAGGGAESESGVPALPERPAKLPNRPVRQNLLPLLTGHPELTRRGLSPETCTLLGCGYLPEGGRSPLAGRIVFQVRGVRPGADGQAAPVILTHVGRVLVGKDEAEDPKWHKWHFYEGFQKTLELYNIDQLLLDAAAREQAQTSGHVLLVEGCFDVAKLVEAGIRNVGATFGAHLDEDQLPRLREVAATTGVSRFRVWYDRDPAGKAGQEKALALLNASGDLTGEGFDWEVAFPSPTRGSVKIPETYTDPGEFTVQQLSFLKERGIL